MRKIKSGLIAFFICFFVITSISQNNDSLYKVFNSKNYHDTLRVKALMEMAQNFLYSIPDSARSLATKAQKFSKEKKLLLWETRALKAIGVSYYAVGDYKSAMSYIEESAEKLKNTEYYADLAKAYNIIAVLNRSLSKLPEAIEYQKKSIELNLKIKNESGAADSYNNIGIVYKDIGNNPLALQNYIKALKIYDKLGESKSSEKTYGNIGIVYQILGNYDEALMNYFKSLEINKKTNDKRQKASTLLNIGNNYLLQHKFDSARKYLYIGLAIAKETQDVYVISAVYNSFGEIYTDQNKLDSAIKYLSLSAELLHNSGSKLNEAISLNTLSEVYFRLGKTQKAIDLSEKALKIFQEINTPVDESTARLQLYLYHKKNKNYKEALDQYENYKRILDTLTKKENLQEITKRQLNYEFDKKTVQDSLKNETQKQIREVSYNQSLRVQRIYTFVGIFGFIFAIGISLFIYRNYKQKQKANVLLEEQKSEITHQKELIEEKQKEIIDSINYAKRIQSTLLAHTDFLNDNIPNNFVLFKPKDIVSGDFYWATRHEDLFYLAVCDSTGHGVPGAFMSLLNIGFLSEAINEKNILEPHKVFNYVRQRLIDGISKEGQKDGFDGILICIDQRTKKMSYVAANNAPIIIKNGEIHELEKDRMPVGKGERTESFTLHQLELQKGDSLYLYTDGYADQFGGPKGKKFLYKRLNDLLKTLDPEDLYKRGDKLNVKFEEWKGQLEQVDDVLVIGLKS